MTRQLGVIFDMDGVLVDSTEAHYEAWCGLAREIGVPCTRDIFESTFGMHNLQIIPLWLQRELADEELDRLSRRKEEIYREVAPGSITVLPGVGELIEALARESDRPIWLFGPSKTLEETGSFMTFSPDAGSRSFRPHRRSRDSRCSGSSCRTGIRGFPPVSWVPPRATAPPR